MSHYDLLGVDAKATLKEIKRAYRDLSKEHHPDKGGDEEIFKKIKEAYETLSDEGKRAAYDDGTIYVDANEIKHQAKTNIIHLFLSCLGSPAPIHKDMFSMMYREISDKKREINQKLKMEDSLIDKYKKMHKALMPEESFLHRVLEDEMAGCDRTKMNLEREIEVNAAMKVILDENKFNIESESTFTSIGNDDRFFIGGIEAMRMEGW